MKKIVLAACAALSLSANFATADFNCGENGHLMIYDIADVEQVVKGEYNLFIAQYSGEHFQGWTFQPSEEGCTDTQFHNVVLRNPNGTQVEGLGGVQQIAELVALFLNK